MRSLRICLLALMATLLLGVASAPAADRTATVHCGLVVPTLGNVHRFVGQPVTYDLTNNDTRYFQATVDWGDGVRDGAVFFPGDSFEFSHSYTSAGSYKPELYFEVADPTVPGNLCGGSFTLGTVRVSRAPR